MNKIVLIGNGYDIAAGVNTSYKSFTLYLLKKYMINAMSDTIDTPLFYCPRIHMSNIDQAKAVINSFSMLEKLVEAFSYGTNKHTYHAMVIKGMFKSMIDQYSMNNWVDIEHLYFKRLVEAHKYSKDHRVSGGNPDYSRIINLNDQLAEIQKELSIFLNEEMKNFNKVAAVESMRVLHEQISPINLKSTDTDDLIRLLSDDVTTYISFNYTPVISTILFELRKFIKYRFIAIHGTISIADYPMIFGYGDDTTPEFEQFELDTEDHALINMKTSKYPLNGQYQNVLEVLESGEYEVYIVGHSCGISDRTLLQTIFENPNCTQIHVYHFKGLEEFSKKAMAIQRNFKNKGLYRARVKFNEKLTIPQVQPNTTTENQGG